MFLLTFVNDRSYFVKIINLCSLLNISAVMTTNAAKAPLIRLLASKSFATAASHPATCPADVQVTTLPNKIVVASADSPTSGLAKLSIAIKAGSRYETIDNYGTSFILRNSVGLATTGASQFAIIRNLQHLGANLSATSDQETIVYTLETHSTNLPLALPFLKRAVCGQSFRPWDLSDNIPRIKYELHTLPPQIKLFDLIHRAAYRTGLGNSILCKKNYLRKIDSETLKHFVGMNFKTNRTAVTAVGIPHGLAVDFAQNLTFETGTNENVTSKYYGGEIRSEKDTPLTYVALAGEASGLQKKDVFVYAVVKHALGGTSSVAYGTGASPLAKALANLPAPAAAQAFNITHSDSGLLGVLIAAVPSNIDTACEAVMKTLKSGLQDPDVKRAKAQLKAEILTNSESADGLLSDITNQAIALGGVNNSTKLIGMVDAVTTAQVQEVLQRCVSSKKSLASMGNVSRVPYLDQL